MSPDDGQAITPQAAEAERSALLSDANFRQRAAAGGSEWERLSALNAACVAGMEPDADEAPPPQQVQPQAAPAEDDDAPSYEPPASPSAYDLPLQDAVRAGLAVDFAAEAEMKTALHSAGVDNHLAGLLYSAAIHAASKPATPVQQAGEYITSETALRRSWGAAFNQNLSLAKAEAIRVYEKLPASVTGGANFADWCASSGLGNSKVVIENFYWRAAARAGGQ